MDDLYDPEFGFPPYRVSSSSARVRVVRDARNGTATVPVLPEEGYRRLRDEIMAGRFQPNEHLVEAALGEAFSMPRAVVRMALLRLEQEGLVERQRYRGARVRLVAEEEAIEILEARTALEAVSARRAATGITDAGRHELRAIVDGLEHARDEGNLLEMSELNSALHAKIVDLSRSRPLAQLLSTLSSQVVRFRHRTILLPGRSAASFAEHEAIVSAIEAGDATAAERAMRDHLSQVQEAVRRLARLPGGK